MGKPHKKEMGRPLERVPLRTLIKGIREDIERKLEEIGPMEASANPSKPKRK